MAGPAHGFERTPRLLRCAAIPAIGPGRGDTIMLRYALIFAVISIIAGFFGFGGVSAATAGIAKIFFFIAIAIFLLFVILAVTGVNLLS
jgi:uncharacterized membrane protein YtjA (UPF0391 family)